MFMFMFILLTQPICILLPQSQLRGTLAPSKLSKVGGEIAALLMDIVSEEPEVCYENCEQNLGIIYWFIVPNT